MSLIWALNTVVDKFLYINFKDLRLQCMICLAKVFYQYLAINNRIEV